jgi:hypothetical protein
LLSASAGQPESGGRDFIREQAAPRNITPPGGEYRWHYDRNAATAILYLNEVPGGETEMFPNYRLVFRYSA